MLHIEHYSPQLLLIDQFFSIFDSETAVRDLRLNAVSREKSILADIGAEQRVRITVAQEARSMLHCN